MTITDDFKSIIDEDISQCEYELKSGNKQSREDLHMILISKYGKIVDGFQDGLCGLWFDDDGTDCKSDLEIMRQKLLLFKAMEYKNPYSENSSGITFNNINQLSATFNISFTEAKKQIENMTSLTDSEIVEIHTKIDELEKIIISSERKTRKWDKVKEIIKWVADKGVDVALTLLPLILNLR